MYVTQQKIFAIVEFEDLEAGGVRLNKKGSLVCCRKWVISCISPEKIRLLNVLMIKSYGDDGHGNEE